MTPRRETLAAARKGHRPLKLEFKNEPEMTVCWGDRTEWPCDAERLLALVADLAAALGTALGYALHGEACAFLLNGQGCDCGWEPREAAIDRLLADLGPDT